MDDLISRQAAINELDHAAWGKEWDKALAKAMLESLPSAQPERKKGKWEEREVSSEKVIDEWQSARCSVCGKYHTTPYMYYFDNFSFCPNCGADMRGENNGK